VTIEQFPLAVTELAPESMLFRARSWRARGLAFSGSEAHTMTLPVLQSYLDRARFDVLTDVTYFDLNRGRAVPFGHLENSLDGLFEWLEAQDETGRALESGGSQATLEAWVAGALDPGAQPFLDDAERATPEQWFGLVEGVKTLLGRCSEGMWRSLRAESRLKLWLAANDRRTDLEELVSLRWFTDGNVPTLAEKGQVYAELPFFRDPNHEVPDDCYLLGDDELRLICSLRAARWLDHNRLELELFAFIGLVDMAEATPEVRVSLVDVANNRSLPLQVVPKRNPAATRYGNHRHQNYDSGAVTVIVEVSELLQCATGENCSAWTLDVELTVRGVTRR